MLTLKKNHLYALKYKDQYVRNYAWKTPKDKQKWILSDKLVPCPLPDAIKKELLNDPEITFEDLGSI